jgi:hypothetical protein
VDGLGWADLLHRDTAAARIATRADLGEVLRTTGFSASPGVLRILGAIPGVGLRIFIIVTAWMLLTFVVAIRQAFDYESTRRELAECILGWIVHGLLFLMCKSVPQIVAT